MTVHSECRACGRPLDDPVSQQMGVGPQCFAQNPHPYLKGYLKDVVKELEANPGQWARIFENLLEAKVAARWASALKEVNGLDVAYRHIRAEEGPYAVYARWAR